jgi:hypothetical protein
MVGQLSGYSPGGGGAVGRSGGATDQAPSKGYWGLEKLKRAYIDYTGTKREEIEEQQDARRFVHGSQYTAEQLKTLNLRKQPPVWENITARKIRGIVGTLERLKQDPKAYPRTPKHEEGAELATATLRYCLDSQDWSAIDPICSEMAAIDGIAGIEFNLEAGDQGDPEIGIEEVYTDSFFYDPRSYMSDFSDARYMGVGKWMDIDAATDLLPNHEEELRAAVGSGEELSSDSDREHKWFMTENDVQKLRLVECWYKHKGDWCYAVFTGAGILEEGKSPFTDEKGKSEHKYEMFSAYIDQDGDRYGIVRDLKPLNTEMNFRRSKALYTMLGRRVMAPQGAFPDIEKARIEAARPDGVVIYQNQGADLKPEFDDAARLAETEAQFKFYESLKTSIESFGPNIAVTGEGLETSSGRAIHLLQQAGLADLGPFIQSYRGWKIRVYRKMWNAVQQHWRGERWIRVTDDDDLTEFVQVNGVEMDPQTNKPTMFNALGNLDVDIILDEGPDTVNAMADAYDTLSALGKQGVPPELAKQWLEIQLELSPLPLSIKKKCQDILNPPEPDPQQQAEMDQRKMIEMQHAIEVVKQTAADAELKKAQAIKAISDANRPDGAAEVDDPRRVEMEIAEKAASIEKTLAEKAKIEMEMQLEPQRLAIEQQDKERDRQEATADKQFDRQLRVGEYTMQSRKMEADTKESEHKARKAGAEADTTETESRAKANVEGGVKAMTGASQAIAQAATQLAQGSQKMSGAVEKLAKVMAADTEIVRDPKTGRAVGARKVVDK